MREKHCSRKTTNSNTSTIRKKPFCCSYAKPALKPTAPMRHPHAPCTLKGAHKPLLVRKPLPAETTRRIALSKGLRLPPEKPTITADTAPAEYRHPSLSLQSSQSLNVPVIFPKSIRTTDPPESRSVSLSMSPYRRSQNCRCKIWRCLNTVMIFSSSIAVSEFARGGNSPGLTISSLIFDFSNPRYQAHQNTCLSRMVTSITWYSKHHFPLSDSLLSMDSIYDRHDQRKALMKRDSKQSTIFSPSIRWWKTGKSGYLNTIFFPRQSHTIPDSCGVYIRDSKRSHHACGWLQGSNFPTYR